MKTVLLPSWVKYFNMSSLFNQRTYDISLAWALVGCISLNIIIKYYTVLYIFLLDIKYESINLG